MLAVCTFHLFRFQKRVEELQEEVKRAQSELKKAKEIHEEKIATLTSELEEAKKTGADELLEELNKVTSFNCSTTFDGAIVIKYRLIFRVYLLCFSFLVSSQRRGI